MERLGEPVTLTEATVQEIQLELLRRTSFNALDGAIVARTLLDYRELWTAVFLDRGPFWTENHIRYLPCLWMIKARDMPRNIHHADTLFVLCPGIPQASRLAEIADDWCGEVNVVDDPKEIGFTAGLYREPAAIVTVWWD